MCLSIFLLIGAGVFHFLLLGLSVMSITLWLQDLISLGNIGSVEILVLCRSAIGRSYAKCTFNFIRNYKNCFIT